MKSLKKLLAVVLSIAMVLGTLTVTAMAEATEINDVAGLNSLMTNGGEGKLTVDIDLEKTAMATITEGVEVTLDLNGKKITRSTAGGILVNEGTLTIKDTSTNADGWIGYGSTSNVGGTIPVSNSGTLYLQSGGFKQMKNNNTGASANGLFVNSGTIEMSGGFISDLICSGTSGKRHVIYNTGTIKMSGGTISGLKTTSKDAIAICNAGKFEMSGGSITGNDVSSNNRRVLQNNASTAEMKLSGGEIYGNTVGTGSDVNVYNGTCAISDNMMINGVIAKGSTTGTISITGGWFKSQPDTSWIAEGYRWKADTTHEGYAGQVIEGTAPKVAEVKIGTETTQYESYDEAIAAAAATESTATVKLLEDCVKTAALTTINAGTEVTLDLNGCALTNTAKARYFTVNGTLEITDTSADKDGSMTGSGSFSTYGGLVMVSGGTLNITGGTFYEAPNSTSSWYIATSGGGTISISDGWFTEETQPSSKHIATNYSLLQVEDAAKAATPYTVSNTTKQITYLSNGADGTQPTGQTYAYKAGYTVSMNTRSFTYMKDKKVCVGWSTDKAATPSSSGLIGSGEAVNFADESRFGTGDIDLYPVFADVTAANAVCVATNDTTRMYADIAAALYYNDDATLIANVTGRNTITAKAGANAKRLNLNGYNVKANTAEDATGSALVIKTTVSIYNDKTGVGTYAAGSEGIVEGYAQGTGGAIDVNGAGIAYIYGGTFTGDAPNNGTVLVCSKSGDNSGKAYIYGGTFVPANSESTVTSIYAGSGKVFVMADTQSDVKIQGVMGKAGTGTLGITGGYFAVAQPNATIGTYDALNDKIDADPDMSLIANTGDETHPYSVGTAPWKITYVLNDGENDPANPATVAKNDTTVITLQPATKDGYKFTGWTDADGNTVTALKGTELTADITLTANFEIEVYNITYDNLNSGTHTNPATYTINDNITLVDAERPGTNYYMTKWTLNDKDGEEVTGWKAGEKTGDITLYANWSGYTADVNGEKCKTIDDAVEAAKLITDTVTIKILKDFSLTSRINLKDALSSDFVLDLNGKKITKKDFTESGIIVYSGDLTIKGNGTVVDNSTNEATATARSIVCQRAGATLTIEGGTFEKFVKSTTNASSTEGAGATIVAGTFSFNPSEDTTSTLKEGSTFDEKEAPYTVYVAAASVTTEGVTTLYKFTKSSTLEKSALDNIVDGSVMKLYADAKGKKEFDTNMTFTINLNGFKYEKVDEQASTTETIEDLLTAADGHEIFFETEGDIITVTIKDTVTYAITYVVGEGTNDPANPATYTETTKTFQLKDATPNDESYSFQGWYDDATAGNRVTEIAKGTSGDLTLHARYSNTAVATVMVDGVKKNYVSIAAAIAAAIANPDKDGVATVTLTGNDLDDTITVKDAPCKVVIDFDGKDVNAAAGKDAVSITNSVVNFNNGKIIIYKPIYVNENAICLTSGVNVTKGDGYEGSSMFESKGIILFGGVVLTVSPIVNQTASAASLSTFGATLSDSINPEVNFYFAKKAGSTDVPTIKVVSPNGTETLDATSLGDGKYSAKLSSLTPNQLAEEIEITPMVGDTAIGNTKKITMLSYLTQLAEEELAKGEGADETLLNLLADTIKYGSELQKYMKEGTAFDVPSILESYVTTGAPVVTDSVKATTQSATDAQNYLIKSASLNIDVKVSAFFVVYSTDNTAKLNITIGGETDSYTLSECAVVTSMGENFYRVQTKALSALEYDEPITITLTDSTGTTTYHAITYSVNSYCYAMSEKVLASSDLTAAIFRYGKSAEAYVVEP